MLRAAARTEGPLDEVLAELRVLPGQRGILIGIGGHPALLEVFDHPATLAEQWSALIGGVMADATLVAPRRTSGRRARTFIARVSGQRLEAVPGSAEPNLVEARDDLAAVEGLTGDSERLVHLAALQHPARTGVCCMTSEWVAPTAVQADRSIGVVVGSAAGDSLGAGYEFGPPLRPGSPVHMQGGGAFRWEPGEWTDDTQMALAILTPLADGIPDVDSIEAGFRAWFASGPADVGAQTRAVLRSPGSLAPAAAAFTAGRPNRAAGNGSLMRTGPIALAHPGDPAAIAELAATVSSLTHPDPDCVDACVLWSVAIDQSIRNAPRSDLPWDWVAALRVAVQYLPAASQDRWQGRIGEAAASDPTDFPNNGWVVHAFQAALSSICSTPVPTDDPPATHLRLALEKAVRAGGDTDTVAAIAGAMLGARWGATALPFAWRRLLHGRRTYDTEHLRTADLERLARLAFRGGASDETGWPTIKSMLPHYAEVWPSRPVRAVFAGIEFGNVAGLPGAVADGADTVISLCRMGTDDVSRSIGHHTLGLLDTTEAENPNLDFILADTVDGLSCLIHEGRRVYVHCVQAQNRTPTVAAAWLRHHGVTTAGALSAVATALNQPKPFLAEAVDRLPAVDGQKVVAPGDSESGVEGSPT